MQKIGIILANLVGLFIMMMIVGSIINERDSDPIDVIFGGLRREITRGRQRTCPVVSGRRFEQYVWDLRVWTVEELGVGSSAFYCGPAFWVRVFGPQRSSVTAMDGKFRP